VPIPLRHERFLVVDARPFSVVTSLWVAPPVGAGSDGAVGLRGWFDKSPARRPHRFLAYAAAKHETHPLDSIAKLQ
jgi:hypothetical protein